MHIKLIKNIKYKIKLILRDLSYIFFILLLITCAIVGFLAYITNNSKLGLIAALCGILYAFFAGKGKKICFIFGIIYSIIYSYIAYLQKLYGEVMLNTLFYIPINIIGFILWSANQNKQKTKIIIRFAPKNELYISFIITIIITFIYGKFLSNINASFPYLNAFSVIAQIISFYLQIKRYVENYMLVTCANVVSIFFWVFIIKDSIENLAQLLTYIIFLIIGIVYWINWHKEAKCKQ